MLHGTQLKSKSCLSIYAVLEKLNPLAGLNWHELGKAYRIFLNNPSQGILHIIEAARNSNWQKWVQARLASQAENLAGVLVEIDIQELSKLPEHTLGKAYARHIINQGFDPEAFVTPNNNEDWVGKRLALGHDIHHVIAGFDGTPIGEFGLAAYVLVQYGNMLNVFVLSHAPWFAIGNPWLIWQLSDISYTDPYGYSVGFKSSC